MSSSNPRGIHLLEVLPGMRVAYYSRRKGVMRTGVVEHVKIYREDTAASQYRDFVIKTKVLLWIDPLENSRWESRLRWVNYGSLKMWRNGHNDQPALLEAYKESEERMEEAYAKIR